MKEAIKKFWEKFWFIVWKDDSLKGWVISLLFIFILIKGVFFPVLSLVTGTSLPLVIVESCSMYHNKNLLSNFDEWWDNHEIKYFKEKINKNAFLNFPFKKGLNKGDILLTTNIKPGEIRLGDVIIFKVNGNTPVIHRVIDIENKSGKYFFSTMGDNNNGQWNFEKNISSERIIGKAQANIAPYLGWIKLVFFEYNKPESQRGFCKESQSLKSAL